MENHRILVKCMISGYPHFRKPPEMAELEDFLRRDCHVATDLQNQITRIAMDITQRLSVERSPPRGMRGHHI